MAGLMLGLGIVKERRVLVASALLLSATGCGGNEFTPASGGSGAMGGSDVGGEGPGGASGAAGGNGGESTGGTGAAGMAGSGGSMTPSCSCRAGQYCREGSTDCFDCAELSRLRFAAPERLLTLSDNAQSSRFPRIGSTSTDLLYFFEGVGIRYTTDASTSAGGTVTLTAPDDHAPLLLDGAGLSIGSMTGDNFVFDRMLEGRRRIYVGRWNNGLEAANPAPTPFDGGGNDYSMAVATRPADQASPRAYWMTDRNMVPELVTAQPDSATATTVAVELIERTCTSASFDPADTDVTPWVTPDGTTLLVSHAGVDASCKPTGRGKDLYIAPLTATGDKLAFPAVVINDVNSQKDDVDPSFSADMCDLYFASNRAGENFSLYRAHRR